VQVVPMWLIQVVLFTWQWAWNSFQNRNKSGYWQCQEIALESRLQYNKKTQFIIVKKKCFKINWFRAKQICLMVHMAHCTTTTPPSSPSSLCYWNRWLTVFFCRVIRRAFLCWVLPVNVPFLFEQDPVFNFN
jgi:hypothetical protein